MNGDITRIFDILHFAEEKYKNKACLAGKKAGKWKVYTHREVIEKANYLSTAFLGAGLKKGDRIVNISDNRPEWNFVDMGALQIGAVHVPVFPTISHDELKYILEEVEPSLVFVSSRFLSKRVLKIMGSDYSGRIFSLDQSSEKNGVAHYSELIAEGERNFNQDALESARGEVGTDDLASIIYTSGTTTMPKGVMLTHRNHIENFKVAASSIGVEPTMTYLCYLPLSHSYERMVNYIAILKGVPVYYNENMANIITNFSKVKPGILVTVPLLLERIYKGVINKQEELKGLQKMIYRRALKFALSGKDPAGLSYTDRQRYRIFDRLVFRKWKAMLGGNVTKIIVGGAAVSRPVYFFFRMIGIPVYEGYGLTEMAPLISYNNTDCNKVGTVGQTLANVMVKISDDGEVLAKGPNLMKGYYKHDELTAEAIDEEGWLHTGDIGEVDKEYYLKITGRKKDIFKTSSGIYVYPEKIENQLKLSSFVDFVMVVGEYKDYLSAIFVLNMDYTLKWAKRNGIKDSFKKLAENNEIHQQIQEQVDAYNAEAREAHQVKKFRLLTDEWSIDNGELTPSMKLKRRNLLKRYQEVVESFYASRAL